MIAFAETMPPKKEDSYLDASFDSFLCDSCAKSFYRKDSLNKHLKTVHGINTVAKKIDASEKPFICDTCSKSFTRRYDVSRHIRSTHLRIKNKDESENQFICDYCAKSFSRKYGLLRHIRETHQRTVVKKERDRRFMCDTCAKSFIRRSHLSKHMRCVHKIVIVNNKESKKSYLCDNCPKSFSQNRSLVSHKQKVHGIDCAKVVEKSFFCDLCSAAYSRKYNVKRHLKNRHGICNDGPKPDESSITKLTFPGEKEFYDWKESIEEKSRSSFRIGYSHNLKSTNGKTVVFICNRSGYYQPRPSYDRKRKSPAYGSKKINGYCPARIKATFTDSGIVVKYSSQHVGHEDTNQLCYMNIPISTREAIASQLIKGVSDGVVLKNIKHTFLTEEYEQKRHHILTRHDVKNIAYKYGVKQRERLEKNDAISVEKWAKEHEDSVLYFKNHDSVDHQFPDLNDDDFILIIMTNSQKEILLQFGNNIILIDSTHGLNGYGFPLTTILIIDDSNMAYPVAFMFSNKVNEHTLEIFFNVVKNNAGELNTRTFMSDMAPEYWNAWNRIFSTPQYRLFCVWNVLRAWRDNLNKILASDQLDLSQDQLREVKRQLYRFLRCDLMEEANVSVFTKELKVFLSSDNTVLKDFLTYFRIYFAPYVEQWAHCYRKTAGIDENMICESFHKVLKHKHLEGNKTRRMNKTLKAISNCLNKSFEIVIINEETGCIEYKPSYIPNRHSKSFEGSFDFIFSYENYWAIESFSEQRSKDKDVKKVYIVRKNQKTCTNESYTCNSICVECNACSHDYICSCPDNSILNNMCKHVHLLCRYLSSKHPENETVQDVMYLSETFDTVIEEPVEDVVDVNMEEKEGITDEVEVRRYSLIKDFMSLVQSAKTEKEIERLETHYRMIFKS